MPLFRQVYVVAVSGGGRLQTVLLEADTPGDARVAALEAIEARHPGLEVVLRGEPELMELPAHWVIGNEFR